MSLNETPVTPLRVLGVDPGTNILGFAVIEVIDKSPRLLELGVVHLDHIDDTSQKLKRIFERIQTIITFHRPQSMAIEAPFYGKNPQSMLKLGRAQGVAMAAAVTLGLDVVEYAPKSIKRAITGNGNASKEQVAAMTQHLLKEPIESKYLDATDALAAALCHYYQNGSTPGTTTTKKKSYSGWGDFVKNNPTKLK